MKKLLCVVILICLAAGTLSGCGLFKKPEEPPAEITGPAPGITLENYERLEIGISYAEACDILGDNAEQLYLHEIFGHESLNVDGYGCGNVPDSDPYSSKLSVWSIKRDFGFFKGVILSFDNGKLAWKANHNLDGKYSDTVKGKNIGYEAFCSLDSFMPMEKVSETIGGYLQLYYEVETATESATIFTTDNITPDLDGAYLWFKFFNDELVCIIHRGENYYDNMTEITDEQFAAVEAGITYEELCKLFNSQGVLGYASWKHNGDTYCEYEWLFKPENGEMERYWFCFSDGKLLEEWKMHLGGFGSI